MYTIQRHLNYNLWANSKIAEIIKDTDENIFDKDVVSSFPSLKKTVLHMWDGESVWFSRINGISPSTWPNQAFAGSKEECLKGLIDSGKKYVDFFADKDSGYAETVVSFKTMSGDAASESIEEIIFHLVNHGSFHRGQLVTMLRTLGVTTITPTDLIRYLRLR